MLETLNRRFIHQLTEKESGLSASFRTYAGTSFLYIRAVPGIKESDIRRIIRTVADELTRKTEWFYECHFVRTSGDQWIYRFRFRVPDEKSFCCGNQCPDCILLRPK